MDWKGQYHFMPNSILFNMSVINISRSERLGDEFVLWVDTDTDPVVFEVLWKELEDFRIANPQWFGSWLS